MLNKIKGILRFIFNFIWKTISPIKYAKHLGVKMGENVVFYGMKTGMFSTEPWLITIGNDVYIGVNTTILAGTKIGNRCIIGACSLVKGEFPDNSVIAGVPARVIKTADEYLKKAEENSLHLGHLHGREKEIELKKYFNVKLAKNTRYDGEN